MPSPLCPKPPWLYRVCRGDQEDLRPVADPLQADNDLELRLQVLDAIVNGGWSRSPWLHWTLDMGVADKYREDARLRYGDVHNYVIRVALPDPPTTRCLTPGEYIRLDSEHEVNKFFEGFMQHESVRELASRQRREG